MKLLVTGGAGFIGSNFILYWLKHHPDDKIINLDKLTYAGNLENLESIASNTHYSFIQGDIADAATVRKAISDVDVVVNFAAESHVDRSISDPSIFIQTNVYGTWILLEQAKMMRVSRFHHISTDEVFGALKLTDTRKFDEQTAYNPRSPYAASKAASDHLVRSYYYTYGLPITISNCSNNFGPYQFPEKMIPLSITNALEDQTIPVYGDGLYVRDWLYVGDHCRAIDLILQKGVIGQTYCLGGLTEDISNLDVVKKIIKILGKDQSLIQFVKDRPGHDRRYAIDWSKAKEALGFSPQYDFDSYLKKTIEWYQEHRDWWQHIKSGEYRTYYQQQYGS